MAHYRLYNSTPGEYCGGEWFSPEHAAAWADKQIPRLAPSLLLVPTDRFGNRTGDPTPLRDVVRKPSYVDTCIEHGPGGTLRLSYQIRVF